MLFDPFSHERHLVAKPDHLNDEDFKIFLH
jgi:hypothetical protein